MTTHNRRCHWKFRLYFHCANHWRRLARRLGHDSGLEDFDRWTAHISKGAWRQSAFFHMYDIDEAIADLQAAELDVVDTIVWTGLDDRHFLLRRQAQHPNEPPLATQKSPQDSHLLSLLSIWQ